MALAGSLWVSRRPGLVGSKLSISLRLPKSESCLSRASPEELELEVELEEELLLEQDERLELEEELERLDEELDPLEGELELLLPPKRCCKNQS